MSAIEGEGSGTEKPGDQRASGDHPLAQRRSAIGPGRVTLRAPPAAFSAARALRQKEAERNANYATGLGHCTDAELAEQRASNEAAGLGAVSDAEATAILDEQRVRNAAKNLGTCTDAEAEEQRRLEMRRMEAEDRLTWRGAATERSYPSRRPPWEPPPGPSK